MKSNGGGVLIMNADDWGRDARTTNSSVGCVDAGAVSSVSAMVFMEDSERAAAIAMERGIEAGLHLNFTTGFSAPGCPSRLLERQQQIGRYLLKHRLAQIVFHSGLIRSFEYVVAAQLNEFRRLYRSDPQRIDGHHHMHLCANVLWQRLLPEGTLVRRNFSFHPGERSRWNLLYRAFVDRKLARRHRLVDYFFSIAPIDPVERLKRIFSLARHSAVEVETHPVDAREFAFLAGGEVFRWTEGIWLGPPSAVVQNAHGGRQEPLLPPV
jgi:hypothetical protein